MRNLPWDPPTRPPLLFPAGLPLALGRDPGRGRDAIFGWSAMLAGGAAGWAVALAMLG